MNGLAVRSLFYDVRVFQETHSITCKDIRLSALIKASPPSDITLCSYIHSFYFSEFYDYFILIPGSTYVLCLKMQEWFLHYNCTIIVFLSRLMVQLQHPLVPLQPHSLSPHQQLQRLHLQQEEHQQEHLHHLWECQWCSTLPSSAAKTHQCQVSRARAEARDMDREGRIQNDSPGL